MFRRAARHLLWFPFLLLALTVILAVTIVSVDRGRDSNAPTPPSTSSENVDTSPRAGEEVATIDAPSNGIDDAAYQEEVVTLMAGEWSAMLRDELVAMRVPNGMRDVHIKLVAMMNQHLAGIDGDPDAAADALIRWSELQAQNPWLR